MTIQKASSRGYKSRGGGRWTPADDNTEGSKQRLYRVRTEAASSGLLLSRLRVNFFRATSNLVLSSDIQWTASKRPRDGRYLHAKNV